MFQITGVKQLEGITFNGFKQQINEFKDMPLRQLSEEIGQFNDNHPFLSVGLDIPSGGKGEWYFFIEMDSLITKSKTPMRGTA